MQDIHLPKIFGTAANIYRVNCKIYPQDKQIYITDEISKAENPIIIYSSGVNDLMRSVGNNPFSIKFDYQTKDLRPNYSYTVEKTNDLGILEDVLKNMKYNLQKIKLINPTSDILVINAPIPTQLEKQQLQLFKQLILSYNQGLRKICDELNILIVDIEKMSPKTFHFDQKQNNKVTDTILETLYQTKFIDSPKTKERKQSIKKYPNSIDYIIKKLQEAYYKKQIHSVDILKKENYKLQMNINVK